MFLKILQNSQKYNFIKTEAQAKVFSCEFSQISKNTFFVEHLIATASVSLNLNLHSQLFYTHLVSLYLFRLTYLYLCSLFTIGNIETTPKFSKLKSISSTEDNYLEATTGSVLYKELFLKILRYSRWSLFLISLQVYWKETPTQVFSWAYCGIFKSAYFKKHLQTTACDNFFTS